MNILRLLNVAKDAVAYYNLNDYVTNINVSTAASNLSKKPEINVILAVFASEEDLMTFGSSKLTDFRVERFDHENKIPYIFFRAIKDMEFYQLTVSMMAPAGVHKSYVFSPPQRTSFSARSRAK